MNIMTKYMKVPKKLIVEEVNIETKQKINLDLTEVAMKNLQLKLNENLWSQHCL